MVEKKSTENNIDRFSYSDGFLKDYDERYVFKHIGFNIRMTDIAASLGIEQLKKLDTLNNKRICIVNTLLKNLKYEKYIQLPVTPPEYFHSFYGFTILVKENEFFNRKQLVNYLEQHRIETRAFMGGNLLKHPAYRDEEYRVSGRLINTEKIETNAFFIGCHPFINDKELKYIINVFGNFFKKYTKT